MEYIPEKHKFRIFLRFLPIILPIAALIAAGVYFGALFTFIPLTALLFAVAVQTVIENFVCVYIYVLSEGVFRIYRKFGKYEKKIFDLDLRFAREALTCAELKKRKEKIKPPPRRRYCLCGAPKKHSFAIVYYPDSRRHIVYIAPDETFFAALKTAVESYSVGAEDPV